MLTSHKKCLKKNPYISFRVSSPKGVIRIPLEDENTIENKLRYLTPNLFSQIIPLQSSRHTYAPVITQDEDKLPLKDNQKYVPQRSRRIQEQATMTIAPQTPASISQQALYSYLGNAVFDTPEWSIPQKIDE